MAINRSTQVLIVGAGPVGMTTALVLARRGVRSTVIDEEGGPAARSYACALHPRSLELLDSLGLVDELLPLGHRVGTVAFHEGAEHRAEIQLSSWPSRFPFLLVVPQNQLEAVLEQALTRETGSPVHWNHRLSDLETHPGGVVATVDQLGGSAGGYIVPRWETVVTRTHTIRSAYLVGADGHNSVVRQRLEIQSDRFQEPALFAIFEFHTDARLPGEMRVAFQAATTNILWPLPGGRYRWSFQMVRKELHEPFPDKDRRAVWIDDVENNRRIEQRLGHLAITRAPWFETTVTRFDWISHVQFERSLVRRLGMNPSWLVGDAAHQTGPAGVQSLNVGLQEAATLADAVAARVQGEGAGGNFAHWERRWRQEWQRLLGVTDILQATPQTAPWLRPHVDKILPCLPAYGEDLERCVQALRLEFARK